MKLLIDTNIVLDVLLKREPFYKAASDVLKLSQQAGVQEYVSASAITDIYYISCKQMKNKTLVRELLKRLLEIVSVAAVSEHEIVNALSLDWADFEDPVQYSVALFNDMDAVITRNPNDYRNANIPIWQPQQLLAELSPQ